MDHIDAIAIAVETLGLNIGSDPLERRAKASFVEQGLKLAGYKIVRAEGERE